MPVRVLIADDHSVMREGLRMILESQGDIQVIGSAANGTDAVALAEALRPDVILMDISMPHLNGIGAAGMIRDRTPGARIIILSMYNTSEHIHRAIRAGVMGFLLKELAGSEIVTAVRTVARGQRFFGSGVEVPLGARGERRVGRSPLDSLSRREIQVLQGVVDGKTSAEIADILSISPKSVDTYRSRIMLKLGVPNLPALVKFAIQHGIAHV